MTYTFGEYLKSFRTREDLTQEALAHRVGVSRTTIINWKKGNTLPENRDLVLRLAEELLLSPADTDRLLFAAQFPTEHQTPADEPARLAEVELVRVNKLIATGVEFPEVPTPSPNLPHTRVPFNTAPLPPENFVPRPDEINLLLTPLLNPTVPRTVAITTALQGGGGFGKTTLAQYICHQPEVIAAFPDGILWLQIRQTPNLTELLNYCIHQFDPAQEQITDVNLAANHLRTVLTGRQVLLVLDDVWRELHVRPFLQNSPTCAHLITTRNQEIGRQVNAQAVTVNEMTTPQAADLLTGSLTVDSANRRKLEDLAEFLGEWPLLLNLAHGYLRKLIETDHRPLPQAIDHLKRRLRKRGVTALDVADESQRDRAVSATMAVSLAELERLSASYDQRWPKEKPRAWADRYRELAIFPEDVAIPITVLARLWGRTAAFDDLDVEDAVNGMRRLSLFTHYEPYHGTVRLHDVIRHYLLEQAEALYQLHSDLLYTYRPLLPDGNATWAGLPEDEPYLWDHLAYHLVEAGLAEQLCMTGQGFAFYYPAAPPSATGRPPCTAGYAI